MSDIPQFGTLQLALLQRLAIDLVCAFVLVRVIYYRVYGRGDQLLTLFAFNLVIFLIAYLLNRVEMTLGAAFGLFAVFSMLRYRTEGISTTDMTYLFLVIALGLIMAIGPGVWYELAILGAGIIMVVYGLEAGWLFPRVVRQDVLYDNIQLVHTSMRRALLNDLKLRTGLVIHRVDVQELDFLKDSARLTIYYHPSDQVVQHDTPAAVRDPGVAGGLAHSGIRTDE